MFEYGKMSGTAVAAVSALAEVYATKAKLNSADIAESRNLSQALVAKVLTQLSNHGVVQGTRGPGGGYQLARKPKSITVFDIVEIFEGHRNAINCPFGPGWCGVGAPCPLHDKLVAMCETTATKLKKLHFADFMSHPKASSS